MNFRTALSAAAFATVLSIGVPAGAAHAEVDPDDWNRYEVCYGDDLIMEEDEQYCVIYYLPV